MPMKPLLLLVLSCLAAGKDLREGGGAEGDRVTCGGPKLLKCPTGSLCVDLPDECHPQLGDQFCAGLCFQSGYHTAHSHLTAQAKRAMAKAQKQESFSCGGKVHRACPASYQCVDLPDNCYPQLGQTDCDGVCYQNSEVPKKAEEENVPKSFVPAAQTKSKSTIPTGSKSTTPTATHELVNCGGPATQSCPANYVCVDLPDQCNPLSGHKNCPGVCYLAAAKSKAPEPASATPLTTGSAQTLHLPQPHNSNGATLFSPFLIFTCLYLPSPYPSSNMFDERAVYKLCSSLCSNYLFSDRLAFQMFKCPNVIV